MHVRNAELALSLQAVPGEGLDSYIERLAWHNRCSVPEILSATGISSGNRYNDFPAGYWVALDDRQISNLASASRLDDRQVHEMLLTRFDGICLTLDRYRTGSEPLRQTALREWAHFTSSHVCPRCLAASAETNRGAAWQLSWRLPWNIACLEHNCLLTATCPNCGQRIRGTSPRASGGYRAQVLPPGICRNRARPQTTPSNICEYPLALSSPTPISDDSPLPDLQQRINDTLRYSVGNHGGSEVPALLWFNDLRVLSALTLSAAQPEDLDHLDNPLQEAFRHYTEERLRRHELRQQRRRSGRTRGGLPRLRPYTSVPQDSTLMAALLSIAVPILDADSPGSQRDQAAWLIDRLRERDRRAPFQLRRALPFSPQLAMTLKPLFQQSTPRPLAAIRTEPHGSQTFEARHIPQLLWNDLYTAELEHLFPQTKRDFARRFCSMTLIRHRLGCTWSEAAATLNLPPNSVSLAYDLSSRLNQAGTQAEFTAAIRQTATLITQRPLTDYADRRSKLSNLTEIPSHAWNRICKAAGVPAGRSEGRRYAAALLWCTLTQGDYRLAPALQQTRPPGRHEPLITRYTRWLKASNRPHLLSPALHDYGVDLLEQQPRTSS